MKPGTTGRLGSLTWRVFEPCPARSPDGYECTGELGHAPGAEGEHCATERTPRGRIVGPVYWDEATCEPVAAPSAGGSEPTGGDR